MSGKAANASGSPARQARTVSSGAQRNIKSKDTFGGFFARIKGLLLHADKPYKEYRHIELARKYFIMGFSVISAAALVISVLLGYSYSGDSIRIVSQMGESYRSDARHYRIVYSEADAFGKSSAELLCRLFAEKTGSTLKIVTDAESVSRHEIRVGHTNRAGDDWLTSVTALGTDGYAILLAAGDNVNITAFSEAGAEAAVKYFINSYVGSYRSGNLVFASRLNFTYVSRSGNEPGTSLRESKLTLNFSEIGKFKILVLSDADINPSTVSAIKAIAEKEAPGLVIFSGDVSSDIKSKAELKDYLTVLTAPLEEKGIPWTAVFGEQDTDGGLSPEAQTEVYSSFEHCVIKSDFISDGAVSGFLPVYKYGGGDISDAPAFGVWTMGQLPMASQSGNGVKGDAVLSESIMEGTDYGYITGSHISFFTESQKLLDRETGGAMPCVIVTHTPIHEVNVIVDEPEKTGLYGNINEPVSSSPVNSGLFAAALGAGNVRGIYFGHDHINTFAGKYCGMELGYVGSIGYDGYGLGGTFDTNNSLRGGRIIDVNLREGAISVSSRMVYAADLGVGIN